MSSSPPFDYNAFSAALEQRRAELVAAGKYGPVEDEEYRGLKDRVDWGKFREAGDSRRQALATQGAQALDDDVYRGTSSNGSTAPNQFMSGLAAQGRAIPQMASDALRASGAYGEMGTFGVVPAEYWPGTFAAKGIDAALDKTMQRPSAEYPWTNALSSAPASIVPFMAAGRVAQVAGKAPGLMAAALGMPVAGGAAFREAQEAGAPRDVQLDAAALNTPVGAAEGLFPGFSFAKPAVGLGAQVVRRGVGAAIEGGQEGLTQTLSNAVARGTYDPNRSLMEGVPESLVAGAAVGAPLANVGGVREKAQDAVQDKAVVQDQQAQQQAQVDANAQKFAQYQQMLAQADPNQIALAMNSPDFAAQDPLLQQAMQERMAVAQQEAAQNPPQPELTQEQKVAQKVQEMLSQAPPDQFDAVLKSIPPEVKGMKLVTQAVKELRAKNKLVKQEAAASQFLGEAPAAPVAPPPQAEEVGIDPQKVAQLARLRQVLASGQINDPVMKAEVERRLGVLMTEVYGPDGVPNRGSQQPTVPVNLTIPTDGPDAIGATPDAPIEIAPVAEPIVTPEAITPETPAGTTGTAPTTTVTDALPAGATPAIEPSASSVQQPAAEGTEVQQPAVEAPTRAIDPEVTEPEKASPMADEAIKGTGPYLFRDDDGALRATEVSPDDIKAIREMAAKATGKKPDDFVEFLPEIWTKGDTESSKAALAAHGLAGKQQLAGRWFRGLVQVSLNQDSETAQKTALHEVGHDIFRHFMEPHERNFFYEHFGQEVPKTGTEAKAQRHARIEERAMDAFASWGFGRYRAKTPVVQKIFERIKKFFDSLASYLKGRGWNSAEDIFGKMLSGEMAQRGASEVKSPGEEAMGEGASPLKPIDESVRVRLNDFTGKLTKADGTSIRFVHPVDLADGSRLSGFTGADKSVFFGYDKNGKSFTIRAARVDPGSIVGDGDFDGLIKKEVARIRSLVESGAVEAFSPIALKPGEEFSITHGESGQKKARYIGRDGDSHEYEYWSETDQKWKKEKRGDAAFQKARTNAPPQTFTASTPRAQFADTEATKALQDLLSALDPGAAIKPPFPGERPAVPADEPAPTTDEKAKLSLHRLVQSLGGHVSMMGRDGRKIFDYGSGLHQIVSASVARSEAAITAAIEKAKKEGAFRRAEADAIGLIVEKRDIDSLITQLQSQFSTTADGPARKLVQLKLDYWKKQRAALGYNPPDAPEAVKAVAAAWNEQAGFAKKEFDGYALDEAAGWLDDYWPFRYRADIKNEIRKGNKSETFVALRDEIARKLIAKDRALRVVTMEEVAARAAEGKQPTSKQKAILARPELVMDSSVTDDKTEPDIMGAKHLAAAFLQGGQMDAPGVSQDVSDAGQKRRAQLTSMMGNLELHRSDLIDPALVDHSIHDIENYFADAAMRTAQFAVWAKTKTDKDGKATIAVSPDEAIEQALTRLAQAAGSDGARPRAEQYIQLVHNLSSASKAEDPAMWQAVNALIGISATLKLSSPWTLIKNQTQLLSLGSMYGISNLPAAMYHSIVNKEAAQESGAVPPLMAGGSYHEEVEGSTTIARKAREIQRAVLSNRFFSMGAQERALLRRPTAFMAAKFAASMSDIIRGGDAKTINAALKNIWQFGNPFIDGPKEAAEQLRQLGLTDKQIQSIKDHPTGLLSQIDSGSQLAAGRPVTLEDVVMARGAAEVNFLSGHPNFTPTIVAANNSVSRLARFLMTFPYNMIRQNVNKGIKPALGVGRGGGLTLRNKNFRPAISLAIGQVAAGELIWVITKALFSKDRESDYEDNKWKKWMIDRTIEDLSEAGSISLLDRPLDIIYQLSGFGIPAKTVTDTILAAWHEAQRTGIDLPVKYEMEEAAHIIIERLERETAAWGTLKRAYRGQKDFPATANNARIAARKYKPELSKKDWWARTVDETTQDIKDLGPRVPTKYHVELARARTAIEKGDPEDIYKMTARGVYVMSLGEQVSIKKAEKRFRQSMMDSAPLSDITESAKDFTPETNERLRGFQDYMTEIGMADRAKSFLEVHRIYVESLNLALEQVPDSDETAQPAGEK